MGADADFLSMAGSIFRTCYITFTCLICDLYLIERIFLRRRKRTALILYYVMKTLALNIIMGMVLDPFFQGNIWWDTIYTIVGMSVFQSIILCSIIHTKNGLSSL